MALNFDAEIRLDISPFIASIQKAQGEVKKLSQQIDALNKKKVNPKVSSVGSGGANVSAGALGGGDAAGLSGSKARMAMARDEVEMQNKLTQAEQINIKTRYQADQMWEKSYQARLKDHQTTSSLIDSTIAQRDKESKAFSNSIKARMQESARAAQQQERNLARERYALYDVAAAYTGIAAGAGAVTVALASTAIDFERAFVNVERTTDFVSAKIGAAAESAKNDLKSLASEIPVAFGQITQIATIGNQLGIAQGALTAFTETVAKFSSTTGVSVDSTAMAFGRIGELLGVPAQEFEKMGSAIAFAGVNAVATEEQILSVTKEIATTAKMAKFTTPEIIGLSTALSSLGIAPEAARGSIIRSFAGINAAISEGGDKLEAYAQIAGMSAQEFGSTWQENGQLAFNAFLRGLQNLSDQGQNLDSVLRSIGMKNVRDIQTIQKLGDNYDVYASSLQDANQGFKEGTFLGDAYSKIQDTVASKLELLQNNFANLFDTLGQGAVGDVFKGILDSVNDLLVRLNQFAKTPLGQAFGALVTIGGALITVIAAINAASALAQASLRAFATAQTSLIGTTGALNVQLQVMNGQLVATGTAGTTAGLGLQKGAIAAHAITTALKAFKWLAIIGGITYAVQEMAIAFSTAEQKAESLIGGFSGLQDALRADIDAFNTALSETGGNVDAARTATGVIAELGTTYENNNEEVNKAIEAQNNLNTFLGVSANNVNLLSTETQNLSFFIGENTRAWLINAIAQSEAFQKMSQNTDAINAIIGAGFNMNSALQAAANGSLDQYLQRVNDNAIAGASDFEKLTYGLVNAGRATAIATQDMGPLGDLLTFIAQKIGGLLGLFPRLASEIAGFFGIDLFPVSNGLQQTGDAVQGVVNQMKILGPTASATNQELASRNAEAYAGQLDEMKKSAGGASAALRTVVDYANDLNAIFSRTFEIRFGRQDSLDSIQSGWDAINQSVEDTAQSIRDSANAIAEANAEIASLTADKSVLAYQLSVAERYGDEARAAQIRAKMAKIDQDIANQKNNISDINSKDNKKETKTEIEKRAVLQDQAKKYADLLEMYAKTGMSKKKLGAEAKKLKQDFIDEAEAAGFTQDQIKPFAKIFDDMGIAIKKTPRDVDVDFQSNISPAINAVNEYLAKLNRAAGTYTTTLKLVLPNTVGLKKIVDGEVYRFMLRAFENNTLTAKQFYKGVYGIDLKNFATGGFVSGPGTSTSDSVPAMLSNGEYVMRASAVGTYGVDFLNAMNQQKVGSFASGGLVSGGSAGGSTVAYLSPEDRSLLRAVIDRPINLYTDNAKIASSANAGNVVLAQRGTK